MIVRSSRFKVCVPTILCMENPYIFIHFCDYSLFVATKHRRIKYPLSTIVYQQHRIPDKHLQDNRELLNS